MYFTPTVVLAALLGTASAHFQLQFPPPRGPFVESKEPTFCGTCNRTIAVVKGAHRLTQMDTQTPCPTARSSRSAAASSR